MQFTRTTTLKLIKILGFGVVAVVIIAYAIWRSLNYARGPEIKIFEPANGSGTASSTIVIRGQSVRTNYLTLNGNPISVDQQGSFSERIVIFPGLNRIELKASDQFDRNTNIQLEIVGLSKFRSEPPREPSAPASASSSLPNLPQNL
jgi:hypothetical protein